MRAALMRPAWRVGIGATLVLVALTLASLAACGSSTSTNTSSSSASCTGTYLIGALSDYRASEIATLGIDAGGFRAGADLGGDPALAASNGKLFWIDRDLDQIFPLDSCGNSPGAFGIRAATAPTVAIDPQDVAAASDGSLWIPAYDVPQLLIREASGAPRTSIDLGSYDADGNPQASSVNIVKTSRGEEAFVALERLHDTAVTAGGSILLSLQPSQMLILDVASQAVQKTVQLAGRNPFGQPVINVTAAGDTQLYFAEPGNEGDAECSCDAAHEPFAGIERFDTETEVGTLIATESALGGSVLEVAVTDDGACGVAIIADPSADNRTSLVAFDPQAVAATTTSDAGANENADAGAATAILGPTDGFDLAALAWVHANGEMLLVGDRSGSGPYEVHVYARAAAPSCALTPMQHVLLDEPPIAFRAVTN